MASSSGNPLITIEEFKQAQQLIYDSKIIRKTPMLHNCESFAPSLVTAQDAAPCTVSFKLENLQAEGSFKTRGVVHAFHKKLGNENNNNNNNNSESKKKLCAMSGGNFARSFCYVAHKTSAGKATVVMPQSVPADRIAICKQYGADVILVAPSEMISTIESLKAQGYVHTIQYIWQPYQTDLTLLCICLFFSMIFIHAFDELELIKAYGSIAFELLHDCPTVDTVIMGVGGGGLIAGVAACLKQLKPSINVIGVEPVASPSMTQSLEQGHAITLDKFTPTICAGLSPPFAGKITYEFVKQYVDKIVLVNDDQVKQALKSLTGDFKLVVEPSGAASVAALMQHANLLDEKFIKDKHVCCILSGGNVPLSDLATYTA